MEKLDRNCRLIKGQVFLWKDKPVLGRSLGSGWGDHSRIGQPRPDRTDMSVGCLIACYRLSKLDRAAIKLEIDKVCQRR